MMDAALKEAGIFLIRILFDFYITVVFLRFIFQVFRADFYNPLSQAIVKITNPPIIPLRRIIPGFAGIDMACLLVLFLLQGIEIFLLYFIQSSGVPKIEGVVVTALASLLSHAITIFSFSLFICIILSWIIPNGHHPMLLLLSQITSPLLRPIHRVLPPMGGFDLSPLVLLILFQLISIVVVKPLNYYGYAML